MRLNFLIRQLKWIIETKHALSAYSIDMFDTFIHQQSTIITIEIISRVSRRSLNVRFDF